jgi:arsenate reductase
MNKTNVLFLCTSNSARSQMAEAFLRRYAGWYFEVYSAGLTPRDINPYTLLVMREIGMDLQGQHSKLLAQFAGQMHFGYMITVCSKAENDCPIFPGVGQRLYWPFEDPAALEGTVDDKLAKFRQVRQQIDAKIREWLNAKQISIKEPEPPLLF